MKIAIVVLAVLLSLSAAYSQTTPALGIRDKTPNLKALTGATIVVSPQTTIENGILLISDGLVVGVGADIDIPTGATIIDVTGLTILPGFVDIYSDYGVPANRESKKRSREPKYEADRQGGSAWNEAIHAEKNWVDSFVPDSAKSAKLMTQGFTVVQSARLDGIFQGRSFVTLLGIGLPNDLIIKSNSMAFGSFTKGSSEQEYPSSLMGSIALIRQALIDAKWYVLAQTAFEQNPRQDRPEFNSALGALSDIVRRRQTLLMASGDELSLLRAEIIAQEFGIDLLELGSGREYLLGNDLSHMSRRLILPVDFPDIPDVAQADKELDYSLGQLRHWEWAASNPSLVHRSKFTFAFTSHGLSKRSDFMKNVRAAVKRGLPSSVALAALTTIPAEMLGLRDQIGSLEPGQLANFIISDTNPFDTDATIYSTWIAGRPFELVDPNSRLLGGTYYPNWPDSSAILTLEVSGAKAKGTLEWGGNKLKLSDIEVDYPIVYFGIAIDSMLPPGTYRVLAQFIGDTLRGQVNYPNGSRLPWRAVKTSQAGAGFNQPADSAATKSWIEQPLVGRLTFPNRAWGFDSVPLPMTVFIQDATVWTVEKEGILENCDIIVRDGKFAAIGTNLTAPEGARIIEANGRHVTPGIIDEHSHLAISGDVNEGTHAVSAEVDIGHVVDPTDVDIYRQLAGGVTCAELLHGSANPIGGQSAVIKLRWGSSAEEMKFDGAGRFIKFALGENVKQSNWGESYSTRYPQTRMGVEAIIRDEFIAAREYVQEWDDYNGLGKKEQARTVPPRRDLRLEAIRDVLRGDLAIVCHAYVQSEMLMLLRLAEEFGIRVWNFIHVLEGYKVADELAAHGATATAFSDWWAYKFEVYDAIPYAASIMVNHGVNTTLNSDNNDLARRLNTEAAKTIQYGGLDPEEAIKLITINSAIQLKAEDRVGSIKVGKDADFVIWNDYPLSIYASPDQTWIDGALFFDRDRDKEMRRELLKERAALIQKALGAASGNGATPQVKNQDSSSTTDPPPYRRDHSEIGGAR